MAHQSLPKPTSLNHECNPPSSKSNPCKYVFLCLGKLWVLIWLLLVVLTFQINKVALCTATGTWSQLRGIRRVGSANGGTHTHYHPVYWQPANGKQQTMSCSNKPINCNQAARLNGHRLAIQLSPEPSGTGWSFWLGSPVYRFLSSGRLGQCMCSQGNK